MQSETSKPAEGGGAVYELVYPGLVVRAYVPAAGVVLVEHIAVSGQAYKLPFGLRLGADPSVVEKLLGPPAETHPQPPDKTQWIYRNLEGTASVRFAIAGDTRSKASNGISSATSRIRLAWSTPDRFSRRDAPPDSSRAKNPARPARRVRDC